MRPDSLPAESHSFVGMARETTTICSNKRFYSTSIQMVHTCPHTQNTLFLLTRPTIPAWPAMKKVHCNFSRRMVKTCKNCSVLIPKLCKPETNLRKKPSKYAHNPQKYANTDKSKQFAISVLFVLDMDIIRYKKVLVGLPSKAFNAQYAQHRGQTKGSYTLDLVIKI